MTKEPNFANAGIEEAQMHDAVSTVIVVPAYNEERSLGRVLADLCSRSYSVVVVDDGSTDGTWAVIKSYPVYGIRHLINLGQGAALQTGMAFAIQRHYDIVVHFDADGQHRADEVPGLIQPILEDRADVVFGSRFIRPEDVRRVPAQKRVLLKCGTVVNGILTGVWLSDAHNGMRALSRKAAELVKLEENGYAHASEILICVKRSRLRYIEVPTRIDYDQYSMEKGQSVWNSVNIVVDVVLRRVFQ